MIRDSTTERDSKLNVPRTVFWEVYIEKNLNVQVTKGKFFLSRPTTSISSFVFPVTIDNEEDIREFVKAKVESLVANFQADNEVSQDTETGRFKSATVRFHRLFNMSEEEKLVNCKF